jgi:predicted nucleic acid-binding Zn ribbon protein
METYTEKIDTATCPFCGGEIEKGNRFCVHCGNSLPRKRKTRLTNRFILFGIIGLILAGAIGFLWTKGLESKLVGKVNGEEITTEEFTKRLDRAKKFYESRYGQNLFEGEAGKENLNRLKTDLLDEITTEKILLQEAKKAGYSAAPEEEIQKQLEAIKNKNGLTDVDLQKMINGSIEDLKKELREGWIISQFIEKNIFKGDQVNGNVIFAQWVTQAKAKARIENYEKLEPVSTAKASCCKTGCGGGGRPQPLDPKIEKEARAKGLEYYEKKTQKKAADAKVTNFGCHIQVDIIEDGKIVASLTYNGEEVQEI